MGAHENEVWFRRVMDEIFSEGRVDRIPELMPLRWTEHQSSIDPPDREGIRRAVTMLHTAFPDFQCRVVEIVATDDGIWARTKATGTHRGPLMGIPPTGRPFEIMGMERCRFQDGKMTDHWGVVDQMGMLEQLGLFPPGPSNGGPKGGPGGPPP